MSTHKSWENVRDAAFKFYEDNCDVHSEKNMAAILNSFEVFNVFAQEEYQRGREETAREILALVQPHYEDVGVDIVDLKNYAKEHGIVLSNNQ